MGNSGRHEFVRATSAGGAGASISFTPALANAYTQAAATSTRGQRRYQVIRVPQYPSAEATGLEAARWNGSSGGVVAIDVRDTLTLGSGTVEGISGTAIFAAGRGFRGAAGVNGTAGSPDIHWRFADAANASHGGKGEGIAGTPRYMARKLNNFGVAVSTTAHIERIDNGAQGYPNGDRARGAPGNAGGGGTDGNPSGGSNDRNAGGGGGGNHAVGGLGGRPWNAPLNDTNGRGGAGYAGLLAFDRVILGGGGGSAGTNNETDDANTYENSAIACGTQTNGNASSGTGFLSGICSSGGAGGGIVILRAREITGSGRIDVRGAHGYNVRNDAGGGGGGGGSVVLYTVAGGNASIDASGGDGGNAWAGRTTGAPSIGDRHGPGGGGGGGFVAFSPNTMAVDANLAGGTPGRTTNGTGDTYGAFGRNGGLSAFLIPNVPGVLPGAQCAPDLRLRKSNGIDQQATSGISTYSLTVTNAAAVPSFGAISIVDVLPAQLSIADGPVALGGPQAADWTCSAASNVVSCSSSAVIAAGGSSAFSFDATVSTTAGQAIINRARVGGGGDPDNPTPGAGNTATCTADDQGPGCAVDADVVQAPLLSIAKSNAAPSPLLAGGSGSYVLTIRNLGSAATSGTIRVIDVLPGGLTFGSAVVTGSGFTCSHSSGVITCDRGAALAIGATVTVTINVTVANDPPNAATNRVRIGGGGDPVKSALPTSATATACPAPTPPQTTNSNVVSGCAAAADPIRRVQLTLAKTDGLNVIPINGQTTYQFTVRNSGDAASTGTIYFRDVVPTPMSWPATLTVGGANAADWSCARDGGGADSGRRLLCTSNASIPAGGSSVFTVIANVGAATAGTQLVNRARIGGGGDPDLVATLASGGGANDTVVSTSCTSDNFQPGCALDLGVAQTGASLLLSKSHTDPQAKSPGDTVTFNLLVSNTGGAATSGEIRVVDVIPAGLTFVAVTGAGGFTCVHTAAPAPGFITCNRATAQQR